MKKWVSMFVLCVCASFTVYAGSIVITHIPPNTLPALTKVAVVDSETNRVPGAIVQPRGAGGVLFRAQKSKTEVEFNLLDSRVRGWNGTGAYYIWIYTDIKGLTTKPDLTKKPQWVSRQKHYFADGNTITLDWSDFKPYDD